jgi:hypothetical protein
MDMEKKRTEADPEKDYQFEEGTLFFTRKAERKFFFLLTVIMLLSGILVKTGIF